MTEESDDRKFNALGETIRLYQVDRLKNAQHWSEFETIKKKWLEAEARVKELEEMHRRVMEEHCPTDEVHCTCVPILREQVKDLEDRLILIVDALNDLNRVLMSGRKI